MVAFNLILTILLHSIYKVSANIGMHHTIDNTYSTNAREWCTAHAIEIGGIGRYF